MKFLKWKLNCGLNMVFFSRKDKSNIKFAIRKELTVQNILNYFYHMVTFIASIFLVVILLDMLFILGNNSLPLIDKLGISNISQEIWSYAPPQSFGLLRFIEGTLITSIYSLIIAIPLSIGISLYVSQYIKNYRIKTTLKFVIELIAAIPSVIIGFWGIFVLGPALREFHLIFTIPYLNTFDIKIQLIDLITSLHLTIGSFTIGIPYLNTPLYPSNNFSIFTATIALVIMIVPIVVSVTISIMDQVPNIQKEAAYALGATPWEMSRMTVIPQSVRGIIGALTLGFGRALGETMAVTMLIGNIYAHPITSIFDTGSSITSIIANSWAENSNDVLARASLVELALILMFISLIINLLARVLVVRSISTGTGRMEG